MADKEDANPYLRVMIRDASIADALYYKEKIAVVDGVDEINWLDDAANIYAALETLPEKTVNEWYKNKNALFSVTVDEEKKTEAIENIRDVIGDENYMTGAASLSDGVGELKDVTKEFKDETKETIMDKVFSRLFKSRFDR